MRQAPSISRRQMPQKSGSSPGSCGVGLGSGTNRTLPRPAKRSRSQFARTEEGWSSQGTQSTTTVSSSHIAAPNVIRRSWPLVGGRNFPTMTPDGYFSMGCLRG